MQDSTETPVNSMFTSIIGREMISQSELPTHNASRSPIKKVPASQPGSSVKIHPLI